MGKSAASAARTAAELIKITTSLSRERDLNHLLGLIVTSARRLTGAEAGRVYILDRTKRTLLPEVAQNERVGDGPAALRAVPLFQGDERETSNVCAYCAFSGQVIKVDDVYRYTGFDFGDLYAYDQATGYRTRSILAVPLRSHEDATIGVLLLLNLKAADSERIIPFDDEAEELVQAFGSQAAVAIDNAGLIDHNRRLIDMLDHTNRELEAENVRLRDRVTVEPRFAIVGESSALMRVFQLMDKVAHQDVTVLLRGETGTGKELFAAAVHGASGRAGGPFVAQNCAAVPENLLESELFGYKKGAFSGAATDKRGLIESADGGTLFLDEIGDMPVGLQAKLLRVLQEQEVRPLGALEGHKVDVRVVAATHCNLEERIQEGSFREDLYYRLSVFPIELPPLRERAEDIPALLQHFLSASRQRFGKRVRGFAPAALDLLMAYPFPGNVRELKNTVERAVLLCEEGGAILAEHLPETVRKAVPKAPEPVPSADGELRDLIQRYEARLLSQKLQAVDWNQTRAAKELGISRRTLIDKMGQYQLRRPADGRGPGA